MAHYAIQIILRKFDDAKGDEDLNKSRISLQTISDHDSQKVFQDVVDLLSQSFSHS